LRPALVAAFEAAGAKIVKTSEAFGADLVCKIRATTEAEINLMRPKSTLVRCATRRGFGAGLSAASCASTKPAASGAAQAAASGASAKPATARAALADAAARAASCIRRRTRS